MAKSIEEKTIDQLSNALMDKRFHYPEFARLMIHATDQEVHKSFFTLLMAYVKYLAIYEQHQYYPNFVVEEAKIAGLIQETLDNGW